MRYKPRYLKKKNHRQLNEFSTENGRIVLNGHLLDGVKNYSVVWHTGSLTELTITIFGKMK